MSSQKIRGIVLSSVDHKEKDKNATIFSLEEGIVFCTFRGVRAQNSKFKLAKEPFCFSELVLEGISDFRIVTSANIIDSFFDITKNYDAYMTGSKILAIIPNIIPKKQPDHRLFIDTIKSLKMLAYEECEPKNILISFLIRALEAEGFRLTLEKCNSCGAPFISKRYLSISTGEILCPNCKTLDSFEISPAVQSCLKLLGKSSFEKLSSVKISSSILDESLLLLSHIFEVRFGRKINL